MNGLLWLFSLFFITSVSQAESRISGREALASIYYKFEVVNYCSLVTQPVLEGFNKLNSELLSQYSFTKEELNIIRGEAWAAGYKEWDNRGLGGFRRWCKNEGVDYAREFTDSR